jgi:GntR family transcriptional regulator
MPPANSTDIFPTAGAVTRDNRTFAIRVRDELRRLIAEGGFSPGDRLPSEAALSERFNVSRATIRESLKLLEQDALIEVAHGRGRFVSPIAGLLVDRPVTRFESVTEMLESLGYRSETQVLDVRVAAATADEAAALGLAPGDGVVRVKRLRTHEDEPLVYSVNCFDVSLLGGEDAARIDFSGSLNAWLAQRGRPPNSSAAQIKAVELPKDAASWPGMEGRNPWLLITERCVDDDGESVLFSLDYHRGDVFTFHVLRRPDT